MENIRREAPGILEGFRAMTKAIDERSPIDAKNKELILIGIFTAVRALRGIDTHVRLAMKAGATKDEIISSIFYALPIVGIPNITMTLEKALHVIEDEMKNKD